MSTIEGRPRLVAACDNCDTAYAAVERPDGEISPIGRLDGCECGSTEFSEYGTVGESDPAAVDD